MYFNNYNLFGFILSAIAGTLVIFLAVIIFLLTSKYLVYKKAGKKGWEALIPFYSIWVLVEITNLKWWFFFIALGAIFLPIVSLGLLSGLGGIVSLIGMFFCHYNLALKFNKDPILYGVCLTILPIIFYPILAFSNNAVFTDKKVSSYGPITEDYVDNYQKSTGQTKNTNKFCKKCGEKTTTGKFCSNCGTETEE
ncbi:MAG: DUF5684 domain-containing protein [Bacilli bacterium]|nr:DUF5684 domain-containing protein [Bacilli bacterium]MDD4795352.1 DUF5684 domain-containing protein [Bacilli bacterium]